MESSKKNASSKVEYPQLIPPLIKSITKHDIAGFDDPDGDTSVIEIGFASVEDQTNPSNPNTMHIHPLSTSMPPSPLRSHTPNIKKVVFEDEEAILGNEIPFLALPDEAGKCMFYSQPIPRGSCSALNEHTSRFDKLRDKRFDSFKTWSGKLERQISNFRGRRVAAEQDPEAQEMPEIETFPVDRFFDALEGPELDELRASEEEILLPTDQRWPFLLRFPISSFGICLGVSSQAIMWKTLATLNSTKFLHITPDINLVLWAISAALTLTIAVTYTLKIIFYFEAVRREYYHPIRINFFFAPWITLLFLALGVPPIVARDLQSPIWYALMSPILVLEIKIYGQWMSGGQRRLSKVANPSNHLSVVGNFVGALLGASMGLREGPIFFFAVGLAHYTVLFVTLYQRLPTNETLPKELHPVFFLFVAAPSVASMAWARIQGRFDYGARIAYFIALFLYFSLVVRVNFFRGFKFSLAWWAYTFPMTGAAIATVRYSDAVCNPLTRSLTVILCTVSTLTVSALLVITIIHAFLLRDLFPNDIVIAISERRPVNTTGLFHMRNASSEAHIEQFLKYSASNGSCNHAEVPAGGIGMDVQQTLTEGRINV